MLAREISKVYRQLAEFPVYTSAYFLKSNSLVSNILVTTSVRDHLRKVKRTVHKYIVSTPTDITVTPVREDSEALATVPSPSGKKLGILREITEGSSKKRFIEVWQGNCLEAAKEVTKTHEEFLTNPLLFSLSFSSSETSLVYTAEAKAPKVSDEAEDDSEKFRYVPDFGERLAGKKYPTLYMFRWNPPEQEQEENHAAPIVVALKPSLPNHSKFVFGQATFSPDDKHIYATGYPETPDGRRLGPAACWNHPSSIFKLELPNLNEISAAAPADSESSAPAVLELKAECLTPPQLGCRSPRVTPGRASIYTTVWLANRIGGAHASATALYALNSNESDPKVLVDYVSEPSERDAFPGLYVDQLPSRPFLCLDLDNDKGATHIVTSSIWGSHALVLLICLKTGYVNPLTSTADSSSWNLLGTNGRAVILSARSTMVSPPELMVALVPPELAYVYKPSLEWKSFDKPNVSPSLRKKLDSIEAEVLDIPNHFPTQVITVKPAGKKFLPTISILHGGPHATYTMEFNPSVLAMALEGYLVNMINYTGSLGFGQKYVDALIGRAGELDVEDCYGSIQHLIKLGLAQEGPGKQFVQGGSHGGFLSAHLIGKYPTFFSASVMRNPVIAVADMAAVTDIPDWTFLEFGMDFGPRTTIAATTFDKLQQASPIAHIENSQAPVLLLIGENDRRVPNSQAKNYFYALKGRGKEVEMLMFPGNGHALDGVEAELVGWESARNWLERFVKK